MATQAADLDAPKLEHVVLNTEENIHPVISLIDRVPAPDKITKTEHVFNLWVIHIGDETVSPTVVKALQASLNRNISTTTLPIALEIHKCDLEVEIQDGRTTDGGHIASARGASLPTLIIGNIIGNAIAGKMGDNHRNVILRLSVSGMAEGKPFDYQFSDHYRARDLDGLQPAFDRVAKQWAQILTGPTASAAAVHEEKTKLSMPLQIKDATPVLAASTDVATASAVAGAVKYSTAQHMQGQWSYDVEKLANQQSCKGNGAWMTGKSMGVETYQVDCEGGVPFYAACNMQGCQKAS